ncbi:uroporphyrinogen-III synthase [Mesonia maritima]|uniref:Uroporphyrinogen-III synthase n=1 Tax=Mesonia maritima TaxID=1793873 RepID=A0ABU1K2Z9_9FLAO|nr:uroporphyrinogen-III synthase [Mesonia maritima]MDR6299691.1 uroporphyrinogen-III synthase [Mesonia maritima]
MPTVLTTKKLEKNQTELLLNANISIVEYNAIKIFFAQNLSLPKSVENAIITSKNAWKAIQHNTTIKNAFVVGSKTAKLLTDHNIQILEKAENAQELAEKIIEKHSEKSFTFFCGNKRRNELPQQLQQNNIKVEEIEVYKTELNPKKFQQEFDGILFFSPSAVQSFTKQNSMKSSTAFCIGKTTASEAKKHTNKIIIANQPTVENVIVQVVKKYRND